MDAPGELSLDELRQQMAQLALEYCGREEVEAFFLPTDAAGFGIAFGTREEIVRLVEHEPMIPYGGKD